MPDGFPWLDWWRRKKEKVPEMEHDPFLWAGIQAVSPWLGAEELKERKVYSQKYQELLKTALESKRGFLGVVAPEVQLQARGKVEQQLTAMGIEHKDLKQVAIPAEKLWERYSKLPRGQQLGIEALGLAVTLPALGYAAPLKGYRALKPLAAKPGIKAILPTAGQVVLAPLAGVEYAAGRALVGLAKGIQLALKPAGLTVKFLDRLVARKRLEQAAKALEKVKAGKEPTKTEADSLKKILKLQQEVGVAAPSTFESTIAPIKTRLVAAIKAIEPLRGIAEEQLHKARTQIAARIHKEFETKTGRAALVAARTAQKGRVPAEKIPGAIAEQFSGEEVGFLFDAVRTSKAFPTREVMTKANIMEALEKMLFLNELPTRGQLVWLERVFGEGFAKAVLGKRPIGTRAWELFLDAVNLPKAAMASWDFSATLRQGGVLFWGHTRQTVPAIIPQIKTFFEGGLSPKRWNAMTVAQRQEITRVVNLGDEVAQKLWKSVTSKERQALGERYYGAMDEAIRTGGEAELKARAQLYLSDIRAVAPQLAALEESFMSRFARYLPLVRRSERAYTMYLNKTRSDIFDHTIGMWRRSGMKVDTTDFPQVKELAAYINNATGRGSLGKLQETGAMLNALMFSPRLQISRLTLPRFLVSRSPAVRKIAARDLATFVGVNSGILSLLILSGVATTELNPLSTDFSKIRIGNTRIEFWAGYQPYVRFIAQLITKARKTITGRRQPVNRWDLIMRFLETKRSPAAGIVQDILRGRTFLGEEIENWGDVATELLDNLVPLFLQDVVEAIEEEGLTGGYLALPGLIGAGVQSYDSAQMVVGEVYYAMTQYQEAQKKLRELIEEKDVKKLAKLIKDSPDAQWVQDKGTVFSNTGRTLSRITRELDKLKKAREQVEKMDDLDSKLRQEAIDEINRRMVKIASEAMMELDRIKDKAGVE